MSELFDLSMITNSDREPMSVIVPLDVCRELTSERETAHLLSSPVMRERLLGARSRTHGISLEKARSRTGTTGNDNIQR